MISIVKGARECDRPAVEKVIVVGFDGSAAGKEAIAGAANRVGPDGRLIIVCAIPAVEDDPSYPVGYEEATEALLAAVNTPLFDGIDYEIRVVAGPPARALVDVARRHHATEIVVGVPATSPSAVEGTPRAMTARAMLEPPVTPIAPIAGEHGGRGRAGNARGTPSPNRQHGPRRDA
jgi:nucleotide-binding universal stress UspA family protein